MNTLLSLIIATLFIIGMIREAVKNYQRAHYRRDTRGRYIALKKKKNTFIAHPAIIQYEPYNFKKNRKEIKK